MRLLKLITNQQTSMMAARATGVPILMACFILGMIGCGSEHPKSQPRVTDLTGIWEGRFAGTTRPPSAVPTLKLRTDGTFTGSNLVDLQMHNPQALSSGEGSWRIRPAGNSWDLQFEFSELNGVATTHYWSAEIIGRQPPYRIKYGWDDPDLGKSVVFSRAQVLIDSDGTYLLDPGDYKLVVSLQPDGGGHLVAYELREPMADAVVASGDAGGNTSRWFFYWSADRELWVHSSDVGTYVWKQANTGYQRHLVTDDATIREMPDAVFDALPDSLKRRWSAKRDPTP